jgi:4-amino-4-deoxy-L-arabinose transferase-like glycosyltransferase
MSIKVKPSQTELHKLTASGRSQQQIALFFILTIIGLSYIFGLFVPLMNNDSAHHANIALRMFLTGDYIHLMDKGMPYLDKPHFLFWTSALSYHVFGVNAFAYKLPSLIFSLLGLWSTYQLGKLLYHKTVGINAALILSTAFAFSLGNSDVRMDAILSAAMIFAAWQLIAFYHSKSWLHLIGSSLGLAIAFSSKGMIGPAVPTIAFLWYLIYKKDLKFLLNPKLHLILPAFFIWISPVLYAYYIQFDLNPDLIIRGQSGRSGVKFILWDQSFERFDGESFGGSRKKDYFFFLHSALWAFLPWPLLFYFGFFLFVKNKIKKQDQGEYMTYGTVALLLTIYSFAGFKLPHYLNTLLSFMAIITAVVFAKESHYKIIKNIQLPVIVVVLAAAFIINTYLFQMNYWLTMILAGSFALGVKLISQSFRQNQKILLISVLASAIVNLSLQINFYPKLLEYQGGNAMAKALNVFDAEIPNEAINYYHYESFSFCFNRGYLFPHLTSQQEIMEKLTSGPVYIYTGIEGKNDLESLENLNIETIIRQPSFRVTRLNGKFLNPQTRDEATFNDYLLKLTTK